MSYRTHHCNQLRATDIGAEVVLSGWISSARDHGGVIFVDLRDREGLTQVVFRPETNPEAATLSHSLREEDVIRVEGQVAARLEGTENSALATGAIEVVVKSIEILNKADVLPFQIDRELSNEDLRLKYRYLDLRRPRLARNLALRHRLTKLARDHFDEHGFIEVETPVLSKSTPEGARDFLVPSRLNAGRFYALPQAPQQYKQLLMVAGVERYFQIARCFRDEDLRADRQPEFTQIDVEASFTSEQELFGLVESLMGRLFKESHGVEIPTPFPRMTYREAMDRFGSDKPDTRLGMEITDVGDLFANSSFKVFRGALDGGGVVRAMNAKGFASVTTGQINRLTELAQQTGAKGLAYIKVEDGQWKSPIVKFFTDEEKAGLVERLGIEEGDLILFGADRWETVCEVLGRVRLEVAEMQGLFATAEGLNFLWVTDFPLLAYSEEDARWVAVHHPFTRPHADDIGALREGRYHEVRARAYDVVLNGYELGGGSLRIHERELQQLMFSALGIEEDEQAEQFGHILDAFRFGAPPHGGIALGLDRIIMLAANEDSIREVIAFPKNNRGQELMTGSPAAVEPRQLRDLRIASTAKPADAGGAGGAGGAGTATEPGAPAPA